MAQTVEDLGKAVKAKYPGQYDTVPDAELGARTKMKYPGSYDQFVDLGTSNPKVPISVTANPVSSLVNRQTKLGSDPRGISINDVLADITPLLRTGASASVGAITGAGGSLIGLPGLGGAAGFSITDELLRKINGEPSGTLSGAKDLSTSIPESTLENLITGKALEGAMGLFKGVGSGVKQLLSKDATILPGTTASQVGPKPYSHPILKTIEDLFAPSAKKDAQAISAKATLADIESKVQDLTGTSVKLTDQHKLTNELTDDLKSQFQKSVDESNSRGVALKLIAKGNPETIPVLSTLPNGQTIQTGSYDVEGKTQSSNTLQALYKLRDEMTAGTVPPDPESKPLKIISAMIKSREAVGPNGNVIDKPLSFAEAWKDKQTINAIAHPGAKMPEIDYNDTRFRAIGSAIDKDIEQSIPGWANGGAQGSKLYDQVNKIVTARHNVFDDVLNTVKLEATTNVDPRIDSIIDNPKLLQKSLMAGKLQVPTNTGYQYSSSNLRKGLQGYQLMRMANDSTVNGEVDSSKLLKSINDPKNQESLTKLFGVKNLSNLKDNFEKYALTDQTVNAQGQRFMGVRIVARGLEFGPAVGGALLGLTTRSPIAAGVGLATTGGAIIGFHGLAKLMTNETTGPIIGKMFSGSALNMSQKLAAQTIASVLKGEYIDTQNGKYRVTQDGKLEPVKDK